jgi:hypothetical protein
LHEGNDFREIWQTSLDDRPQVHSHSYASRGIVLDWQPDFSDIVQAQTENLNNINFLG